MREKFRTPYAPDAAEELQPICRMKDDVENKLSVTLLKNSRPSVEASMMLFMNLRFDWIEMNVIPVLLALTSMASSTSSTTFDVIESAAGWYVAESRSTKGLSDELDYRLPK